MTNKKLVILGLIAVLMVVWAVVETKKADRSSQAENRQYGYLIQGLDPAKVSQIQLAKGADIVTLKRQGDRFVVSDKDNYPADTKQINDLITKVLDIKIREKVTDDPRNHADLEVTEDKAANVIKFFANDDQLIAGAVIGKRAEGGDSYVRLTDADTVYLAENIPWIRSSAMDYVNKQLIRADSDKIAEVTVTDPNGSYTLKKDSESDAIEFVNLPQDKKLGADHKQVFEAVTSLDFSDVLAADKKKMNFDRTYVCKLSDSTVYTLKIAKEGDKTYASCSAEFTDKTEIIKERKVESEEELKKKEAKLLAREAVEKFNAAHNGWLYQVADWKAKNLIKSQADILEDVEKPAPDPNQPAEESTPEPPKEQTVEQPKPLESVTPTVPQEPQAPVTVEDPNAAAVK